MSKKTKTPSSGGRKRRKRQLGRASAALTTAIAAGAVLAPSAADAALTTGPDKPAYEAAVAEGTSTALRDFLRVHPTSATAKQAFVQLAMLCAGGKEVSDRDPDCTGSLSASGVSDPPNPPNPGTRRTTIY